MTAADNTRGDDTTRKWVCVWDGTTAPAQIEVTPACPKCGAPMQFMDVRRA